MEREGSVFSKAFVGIFSDRGEGRRCRYKARKVPIITRKLTMLCYDKDLNLNWATIHN